MGYPVTKKSLYRWATRRNNPIPNHKPAGRLIFIESEIANWVHAARQPYDLL
jgi:predicted DNA-binding transcriptional regulator AlpA